MRVLTFLYPILGITLHLDEQSIDSISLSAVSSLSPSLSRKPSSPSSRRNSFRKGSTPVSVGKILCELLPTATIPSLSSLTPVPNTASTLYFTESPSTHPGKPRISPSTTLPLSSPLSRFLQTMTTPTKEEVCPAACLPTPEVEQSQSDCSLVPVLSTPSNLPSIIPVITTNHSSPLDKPNDLLPDDHNHPVALPPPPRLVVVNPTPNPTPHPTPPATPVLHPPVVANVQLDGDGDAPPSAPLLRVPGQDALIQAQARARSNQMCSKLRLLAHVATYEEENACRSSTDPAYSRTSESGRLQKGM